MTKETTEAVADARKTQAALHGPVPLPQHNAIIELADERDRLAAELETARSQLEKALDPHGEGGWMASALNDAREAEALRAQNARLVALLEQAEFRDRSCACDRECFECGEYRRNGHSKGCGWRLLAEIKGGA